MWVGEQLDPWFRELACEKRYLVIQLCYAGGVTRLLTPDKKTRSL